MIEKPTTPAEPGILYVVATPIGNLKDMSERAINTLRQVDLILAEDTRHSARLLAHYGIATSMRSWHEHNERRNIETVVEHLAGGRSLALISDAGTPLVSDPGFILVRALRERGLPVMAIPGPCALIAALSVAGLPTDRFYFAGFLPSKDAARAVRIAGLKSVRATLVFYESPRRVDATLAALATGLGGERRGAIARELTKVHEASYTGTLFALRERLASSPDEVRGEFVILVEGAAEVAKDEELNERDRNVLEVLAAELPLAQAVALSVKITGRRRNLLYKYAVAQRGGGDEC